LRERERERGGKREKEDGRKGGRDGERETKLFLLLSEE